MSDQTNRPSDVPIIDLRHAPISITPNDVLLSTTMTNMVITHPGNLAFSVLFQMYASKLPLNGELVNVQATACAICDTTYSRGGRFICLESDSSGERLIMERDQVIGRITGTLSTITAIQLIEDALQLSVPELLFTLDKQANVVSPSANSLQPNKFPLSYWFKTEWDSVNGKLRLLGIAAPELPVKDASLQPPPSPSSLPVASESGARLPLITRKMVEDAMPPDASSVFHIFDRRINFDRLAPDASRYSLLRAWVQDDPHRIIPTAGIEMACYDGFLIVDRPASPVLDDSVSSRLTLKRKVFMVEAMKSEAEPSVDIIRDQLVQKAKAIRMQHGERMKRRDEEAKKSLLRRGVAL
jgi:hypothetical protein